MTVRVVDLLEMIVVDLEEVGRWSCLFGVMLLERGAVPGAGQRVAQHRFLELAQRAFPWRREQTQIEHAEQDLILQHRQQVERGRTERPPNLDTDRDDVARPVSEHRNADYPTRHA